jgi:osmotically inducible protein OsmC
MPTRHANAVWEGNLKEGRGEMQFADYSGEFTDASRFGEGAGTNPEELVGAAIAGCFSMALAADLDDAGFKPEHIDSEATVEVHPQPGGGFAITRIHLKTRAKVAGVTDTDFQRIADSTRQNCPVAKALSLPVTLEATFSA